MSRVLVTGARGFVGRPAVQELLRRGHEVVAVSRSGVGSGVAEEAEWIAADLLDARSRHRLLDTSRADVLLHLAWETSHPEFWHMESNLSWVAASIELSREFRERGGRRIVITGSCAEYDWTRGLCLEDVTPLTPETLYGVCKNATREALETWARSLDLTLAWARLFHLYGPHEHPARLVPAAARALLHGQRFRSTGGFCVRDYMHVSDAARALVSIVESDCTGAINVASGSPILVSEVLEQLAKELDRPGQLDFDEAPAEQAPGASITADVSRLAALGTWRPQFDLASGIRDTAAWHKSLPTGAGSR